MISVQGGNEGLYKRGIPLRWPRCKEKGVAILLRKEIAFRRARVKKKNGKVEGEERGRRGLIGSFRSPWKVPTMEQWEKKGRGEELSKALRDDEPKKRGNPSSGSGSKKKGLLLIGKGGKMSTDPAGGKKRGKMELY